MYMEIFYKRQRLHPALGFTAPESFENFSALSTPLHKIKEKWCNFR
jgi:hypothetical protein